MKSRIHPDKIQYKEDTTIDEEDIGHSASLYELNHHNMLLEIAIGKEKYTFSNYEIVYYPIYLVVNEEPVAKIGVFEIEASQVIQSIDDDGDMELRNGNVLIYATDDFLKKELQKRKIPVENDTKEESMENIDLNPIVIEEDDVFALSIPIEKKSPLVQQTDALLLDGIFVASETITSLPLLQEETKEEATTMNAEFKESAKNNWVQNYMKNMNYQVIDNEGGGDCFFAVIRDAFAAIGKNTTVEKLRATLAKEATEELYQQYRALYLNFMAEYQDKEKEMKNIKKLSPILKKRVEATSQKEEKQKILDEAKQLVEKYKKLKEDKEDTKELLDEFVYMENLDTLEKFRAYVLTRNFWADTWAISTLERVLNIKLVLLSESAFLAKDLDSVLLCGQFNDTTPPEFKPDYYIITTYSGDHYKLITYKERTILKYREIPYSIKALIINKCMEKNAGPYYLIPDFRNLKNKLGLDADEGRPEEDEDEYLRRDLYEKDVVFMFHSGSNTAPKAGKGSGEKMEPIRMAEFNALNKIKEWRKKLDDSWLAPFTIENMRWNSVDHFVLGSQYKKGFPDFFSQFSLDSGSDISKDLDIAKAATSKTGKWKDRVLRDKKIQPDPDFYDLGENSRQMVARETALHAKFTQNLDLKKVLLETHMAKLTHFVRGKTPDTDQRLMRLRKKLLLM